MQCSVTNSLVSCVLSVRLSLWRKSLSRCPPASGGVIGLHLVGLACKVYRWWRIDRRQRLGDCLATINHTDYGEGYNERNEGNVNEENFRGAIHPPMIWMRDLELEWTGNTIIKCYISGNLLVLRQKV